MRGIVAGAAVLVLLAACSSQTPAEKAAEDARAIAQVEAAQRNGQPPVKPIDPQPIMFFDIRDGKLTGTGCNFVADGGGMHGGLHRSELATVLVMQGGPFRRGAVAQEAADLTDIVPTVLHALGVPVEGMEGRPLRAAFDATADAPPAREVVPLPGGFALEAMRAADGRFYPTGMRRGG